MFLPCSVGQQQQQATSSSHAPSPPPPPLHSATVFTLLRVEPIPKVRAAALSFLGSILDSSKPFWLAADEMPSLSTKPRSTRTGGTAPASAPAFTSFAATLVSMLRDTHTALWQYLTTEQAVVCTCLALKALALLCTNAPYERLAPGPAAGSVALLAGGSGGTAPIATLPLGTLPLLDSPHVTIRMATLSCLSALFISHGPLPDVRALLFPPAAPSAQPATTSPAISPPLPSLIARLRALSGDIASPHLRAEALACLAALSKPYFVHVQPHWSGLFSALVLPALLNDADPQVLFLSYALAHPTTHAHKHTKTHAFARA